jgi:Flp pilus assembly protein CpaB
MLIIFTHKSLHEPETVPLPEEFKGLVGFPVKVDRVTFHFHQHAFIRPGSKIDVMPTQKLENGKLKASVVLKAVLVYSMESSEKDVQPMTLIVILAVKKEDVKTIAEHVKRGDLQFLLRDPCSRDSHPPSATEEKCSATNVQIQG